MPKIHKMTPSRTSTPPTKSGIVVADGQRLIPASLRPDGSTRKEIRVRPGYLPPEDVEVYKNSRAEAWKNRGSGGVPGAMPVVNHDAAKLEAARTKNAKKKERKRAKKEGGDTEEDRVKQEANETASPAASSKNVADTSPEEKEKLAKAIRKKIRQANDLKTRKEGGESLLPEQLAKVIKLSELMRQLNALGYSE